MIQVLPSLACSWKLRSSASGSHIKERVPSDGFKDTSENRCTYVSQDRTEISIDPSHRAFRAS